MEVNICIMFKGRGNLSFQFLKNTANVFSWFQILTVFEIYVRDFVPAAVASLMLNKEP